MYLEHFGLRELPFQLTPDTSFFFNHATHHEALNVLMVALRSGEGYLKITGEVGTGKTLLCRMLLNSLDDSHVTAYLPNPYLTPQELRLALAEELRINTDEPPNQYKLMQRINQHLIELAATGKQVVLCLDETQAMPKETLETLRLLSNLETEKRKLLHIVMFGQPELDVRLNEPNIRQLRQRITFSYTLRPLDRRSMEGYIHYRLLMAGYNGPPLFNRRTLGQIYHFSRGIPRLINVICHKAMMVAYGEGVRRITAKHINRAAYDTEDIRAHAPALDMIWYKLVGLSTLVVAGVGVLYLWSAFT